MVFILYQLIQDKRRRSGDGGGFELKVRGAWGGIEK
jgi:hypothetical protein